METKLSALVTPELFRAYLLPAKMCTGPKITSTGWKTARLRKPGQR